MENQTSKNRIVAFCGLYCTNCGRHKKGSCPGCIENAKATWCKIRKCCIEKNISSCAACDEYKTPSECKKYNNVIARLIHFVTGTDRELCIKMIKEKGIEAYCIYMDSFGKISLPEK